MNLTNFYKYNRKKIALFVWFFIFSTINLSQSYYFWLKSSNNTPENIEAIEKNYNVNIPIVSFIFDPRAESDVLNSIDRIVEKLWTNRIYHFTISPDMYSANFQKNKRKKHTCNIPYYAWNERLTISTIK